MSDKGQQMGSGTKDDERQAKAFVSCLLFFVLFGRIGVALASASSARVGVVINEVVSSNDQSLIDERGDSPDWIELYNAGDADVDLSGWVLTDKIKKPAEWWRFPDGKTIPAHGYLVVCADSLNTNLATYCHTRFSIGARGETLTLMSADGGYTNSVTFGNIPCDCSCGRSPDGGGTFAYFTETTPGAANAVTTYLEPLDEVQFSVPRGLHDEPFVLALSNAVADAKIYYTTNCSEPSESNGLCYSEPFLVGRTTIVKATAILEGHLPYRNVAAHTYIFPATVADQTAPAGAPKIWSDNNRKCPASYAPSTNVLKTSANRAAFVQALSNAPIVSVTLPEADLFGEAAGIYTHPESLEGRTNEVRQADIEWVTGEDVLGSGVGLSIHGAYSRRFSITAKKGFGLKFRGRYGAGSLKAPVLKRGGCETDEFKTLVLRAENNHHWTSMETDNGGGHPEWGTGMHDQFIRGRQKAMDGWQVEGTQVHLFLNGLYWGVYNLTDSVRDTFAATIWSGSPDLARNYNVVVIDTAEMKGYRARDGVIDDYEELKTLAAKDLTKRANYEALEAKLDLDEFIDYILLECFIANDDWPENGWAVVSSSALGIKARYVAWDCEKSLGTVRLDTLTNASGNNSKSAMSIHRNLIKSSEYKLRFADRAHRHLCCVGGALTADALVADYAALAAIVRPIMYAEAARWGSYSYDNWNQLPWGQRVSKVQYGLDAWDAEYTRLTETWFRNRPEVFLGQVKTATGYDPSAAVAFAKTDESHTMLTVPAGATVWYTTDGSDPREAFTGAARGAVYVAGETLTVQDGGTVKARALKDGAWSVLSEVALKAPMPAVNTFLPTGNESWDEDANWSFGHYPNAAGAIAVIGVPAEVTKKNQRKVEIDNGTGVTVGQLEFTNGEHINNIKSGKTAGGDLHFRGEDGKDATVVVCDEATAGHAVIGLDEPWAVRLDSDVAVTVSNTVGNAESGGMVIDGAIAGGGCNIAKWGPGRLTIAATNVTGDVLGNLQCNEGVLAVETPIRITSVTKEDTIWLPPCVTSLDGAFASSIVCSDKLNKAKVGLFVPTRWGSDEKIFFGGVLTTKAGKDTLKPGKMAVYVLNENGDVFFCGRRWIAYAKEVELGTSTETLTLERTELTVGDVVYQTFKVKIPYFGSAVAEKQVKQNLIESIDEGDSHDAAVAKVEAVVGEDANQVSAKAFAGYITENLISSEAIVDCDYVVASVKLNTDDLISEEAEIEIAEFVVDEGNSMTFEVEIDSWGVESAAIKEMVEASSDLSDWAANKLEVETIFKPGEEGEAGKVTVTPKDTTDRAFLKIVIPKDPDAAE